MKYDAVLFDADETLLDYRKAERRALEKTLNAYGISYSDDIRTCYHDINQTLWELYENGYVTQSRLRVERFERLFTKLGVEIDLSAPQISDDVCDAPMTSFQKYSPVNCCAFNCEYMESIADCGALLEGALDIVQALYGRVPLYIVTNGSISTQKRRLALSGLKPYIADLFISEEIGAQKPDCAYFDEVFRRAKLTCPRRVILLGDSLTSDMRGGHAAGIVTCWFNPQGMAKNSDCDYEIRALADFLPIVLYNFVKNSI